MGERMRVRDYTSAGGDGVGDTRRNPAGSLVLRGLGLSAQPQLLRAVLHDNAASLLAKRPCDEGGIGACLAIYRSGYR